MPDLISFCQLLSSYLCHEMSGSVSAISSSIGLLNAPNTAIKQKATELLKDASDELVEKIKFYSHIYSISHMPDKISFYAIEQLCSSFFCKSPDIAINFSNLSESSSVEPELGKAIMCLIITGYKNLSKRGIITISQQKSSDYTQITVKAEGEKLHYDINVIKLLTGENKNLAATIYNCNEYYITMLNEKMGYKLSVTLLHNSIEYYYTI